VFFHRDWRNEHVHGLFEVWVFDEVDLQPEIDIPRVSEMKMY
jgi:hypothetical protein